jgi:RimJ/RimL family protein N-acetyltransferase
MPRAAPATLRGRHVVLEPLRADHVEELWPAAAERDLWAYMTYDVATPEDLRQWIVDRTAPVARGEALPFLLRDARTGQAFGSSSLFDINAAFHTLELGHTWVGASHRRTAANTEAKLLLLGHAFETLEAIRVQLKCDARNLRSAAAMERIGAVREGVIRHQRLLQDGHKRDAIVFSVTDDEWPAVKARLQGMLAR